MAIYVNGQLVAPELIAEESNRHAANSIFRNMPDDESRRDALRQAAERTAIERVLVSHLAMTDRRQISTEAIEAEVKQQKESAGCRAAFNDGHVRFEVERRLRIQRLMDEMTADAPAVTEDQVARYYAENRPQFVVPAVFESAQIICQVNERQSEEQAYASISAALAALNSGVPFAAAAESYSDCKGNGGLLSTYAAGEMVQEYEEAVHGLDPGQRTGIFDTPFGFHIAELRTKAPSRIAALEEARPSIQEILTHQRKRAAYERAIERLLEAADIRRTGPGHSKVRKSAGGKK